MAPQRRSRKTEEDYVPRPRNCFFVFRSAYRAKVRALLGKIDVKAVSRDAGALWHAMSEEEDKDLWKKEATVEKEIHAAMHPDYKFQSRKRLVNEGGNSTLNGADEVNAMEARAPGPSRQAQSRKRQARAPAHPYSQAVAGSSRSRGQSRTPMQKRANDVPRQMGQEDVPLLPQAPTSSTGRRYLPPLVDEHFALSYPNQPYSHYGQYESSSMGYYANPYHHPVPYPSNFVQEVNAGSPYMFHRMDSSAFSREVDSSYGSGAQSLRFEHPHDAYDTPNSFTWPEPESLDANDSDALASGGAINQPQERHEGDTILSTSIQRRQHDSRILG
ncbi:hypothetical protein CPC08DRAFT_768122 [Agrocybe pediades]|nr:hypothetical protein CPC08DRAFT_768122 [Agrocybe pediades]